MRKLLSHENSAGVRSRRSDPKEKIQASTETPRAPAPDSPLGCIADIATGLRAVADKAGLDVISRLLALAAEEAGGPRPRQPAATHRLRLVPPLPSTGE